MRLGALLMVACTLLPAIAAAQDYRTGARTASSSVLRPASTVGWRNYVAVPDGPCGHPVAVQTDCYVNCRPCGPLRPFCFLHRVGRMLDCLIPCNLCCRSGCGGCGGGGCGGCGPGGCGSPQANHGCLLGGRKYGCNVCCGAPACGGGGCGCAHPCGSAFESCCTPACTTGGTCHGCSSALPGINSDPFIDDPLPMPPKPTAESATEVRRAPARPARPTAAQPRVTTTTAPKPQSPYKIVRATNNPPARQTAPTTSQSVLRRASAEQYSSEPATLKADQRRAAPIVRSQSPDEASDVPANPLR
jgi:hypothetical protein